MPRKRKAPTFRPAEYEGRIVYREFEIDEWPPEYEAKFTELLDFLGLAFNVPRDYFYEPHDQLELRGKAPNGTVVIRMWIEGLTPMSALDAAVVAIATERERSSGSGE